QGDAVADTGEALFVPDTDGAFRQNADAGVAALGLLDRGILTVTRAQITLAGTAPSPQVGRTINTVLEGAADGTLTDLEITYLDDGSPAAFTLAYDAATGARVEGRLPTSLDVDDLASALRLPSVGGTPATALEDAEAGATAEILSVAASLLPEIETLTYARADGASALDMVLSPGANLDLIAADLSERLPGDVVFSVGPLDTPPPDGASRTNAATGLDQLAQNGFWLPATAFDPDKATCTTQTDAVLARNKVSFLPSSADLDATANRALDALTAVILACTDADLTLEVVGHTDTSGNAFDNEALSLERAEVVLEELIARGVPEAAMTAFGVGGSEPIATNDTAEGRAANRRTEIIWFAPGDLREP
ncbi:MAG: OmpA family protein, partial [Pseudomonadota bacterium]